MIEVSSWIFGSILLAIILPAIIIFLLPSDQRADGIAILVAVPVIEYLAISVGIGLGVDPVTSFMLTVLPCIAICMLIMGLLSYFGGAPSLSSSPGSISGRGYPFCSDGTR